MKVAMKKRLMIHPKWRQSEFSTLSRKAIAIINVYPFRFSTVDVQVEAGSGKGWPTDVSSVFYHRQQGLICVGTESGAIYAYGDGFQYMRPHAKDEGVTAKYFAALDPDLLLAAYTDNSFDVLELPSLNLAGDLDKSWIGGRNAKVTAVFVDEPGEKNYAYVGTSEGILHVLDATDSALRVSDFSLTWKTMGVSTMMPISDIKLHPRDERFLAVSFEGALAHQGAVVIYDLAKQKTHKVHETKAITCMSWNHTGEVLYCGKYRRYCGVIPRAEFVSDVIGSLSLPSRRQGRDAVHHGCRQDAPLVALERAS
jgi:hypothetical protein